MEAARAAARRRTDSFDAAFESFYREHVAEVYQYALAVLGNSADAEDVTQQTFLNAFRAFQRGERPQKAHNWLIKIAHNVCRMRWRQSGRRPLEVPLEHAGEPAAPEERPSLDEVLRALAQLPFNQRAAIVMREVEGRSYPEIAEVLGVTVPAVEALLFRARGNLRARRSALAGALGVAPVPASLGSFFGGGSGGLIAAGGAAFGSGVALKVAALVVSGVVAGGLGYKAVDAAGTPARQATRAPQLHRVARSLPTIPFRRPTAGRPVGVAGFRHPPAARSTHEPLRSAPTNDPPATANGGVGAAGGAGGADPPSQRSVTSTVSSIPADTVGGVVAAVPPVPALPAVPTTPVVVPTPVVTVTVAVPPVELPPPHLP